MPDGFGRGEDVGGLRFCVAVGLVVGEVFGSCVPAVQTISIVASRS